MTRPCARGDTSPGGVSGLPKSASPCAPCSHCHRCYIACLASSPSPLAPLHLHLRLAGDPEVTLHHLTVPPRTLASLASPSTTIPSLGAPALKAFSHVNQAPQNPTFQTPPWTNANHAGSIGAAIGAISPVTSSTSVVRVWICWAPCGWLHVRGACTWPSSERGLIFSRHPACCYLVLRDWLTMIRRRT